MGRWYFKWADPLLRFFCLPLKVGRLSVWLKWQTLSTAWRERGERGEGGGGGREGEKEDINTVCPWQSTSPHSAPGFISTFLADGLIVWKQHFLNSPKTPTPEESLPSSPLPSPPLHAPHQAGVELSERFVIMSAQSTPTFTDYQHSQVTCVIQHQRDISGIARRGLHTVVSLFRNNHVQLCLKELLCQAVIIHDQVKKRVENVWSAALLELKWLID